LKPKIHPRRAGDAKFDSAREISSTQPQMWKRGNSRKEMRVSRGSEVRGDSNRIESANGEETRDLGQPGNWSRCRSQGGGTGATRRINRGRPDGTRSEETRASCQPVPEDEYFGETRILIVGDTGGANRRGNPVASQPAPPKDARIEATRRSITGKAGDAGRGAT